MFSFPEADYRLISTLQERALDARVHATQSQVVRAGLVALQRMSGEEFRELMRSVNPIKPGPVKYRD